MIVLDTNVLSETLRADPTPIVLQWLDRCDRASVFTTAITQAEVLYRVEALPSGARRTRLRAAVERLFAQEFPGRILPFDEDAARVFPGIVADRKAIGRPISQFDALIASVCRSRNAKLATRNVRDFERCGFPVINPWEG